MACVIALTLATTLAVREPPRITLVRRETIIQARDPLRTEIDPKPDEPKERRPGLRATVFLPSQTVLYVTDTKEDVMLHAPCLTPRVEAESRPPP